MTKRTQRQQLWAKQRLHHVTLWMSHFPHLHIITCVDVIIHIFDVRIYLSSLLLLLPFSYILVSTVSSVRKWSFFIYVFVPLDVLNCIWVVAICQKGTLWFCFKKCDENKYVDAGLIKLHGNVTLWATVTHFDSTVTSLQT